MTDSSPQNVTTTTHSFDSAGGVIAAFDIYPANLTDTVPLIFLPGWGTPVSIAKNIGYALAEHGRRVLIIDHEHLEHLIKPHEHIYSEVPPLEYSKALGIVALLEHLALPRADMIAHSEGAIAITVVAHKCPHLVRSSILINPAGVLLHDSLWRLTRRFVGAIYKQVSTKRLATRAVSPARVWLSILWYVLTNPIQTYDETFKLPYAHIGGFLRDIEMRAPGSVHVLLTKNDRVFPLPEMKKTLTTISPLSFEVTEGNHIQLYLEPARFAKLIDTMLASYV